MSRKTNPDKKANKLKKQLLIQHDKIHWLTLVIGELKSNSKIRPIIEAVIKKVNNDKDMIKAREQDMQEIVKIFQVDQIIQETKKVQGNLKENGL